MARHRSESNDVPAMVADGLIIALAFVVAMLIHLFLDRDLSTSLGARLGNWNSAPGVMCLLLYGSAYIWIAQQNGLYSFRLPVSRLVQVAKTCQACLNACFVLSGAMFLAHAVSLSREVLIVLTVLSSAALSVSRYVKSCHGRDVRPLSPVSRNIAIIGTNQLSYALSQQLLDANQSLFNFVGFLKFPGCRLSPKISSGSVLGDVSDLREIKSKCFVEVIVIAEFYPYDKTLELVNTAHDLDLDVFSIAGYYEDVTANSSIQYLGLFPVSVLYLTNPRAIGRCLKRVVDITVAIAGLLLAALPMLVIAGIIWLEGKGPVIYASERIGRWGKPFRCLKFRTMVLDADQLQKSLLERNERDAILFKLRNDPRLTRVGGFLRKYSLDELPQLVNVLRGEMSMVGPRPPLPREVASYSLEHLYRLTVMPGLTGLWQVQARQDQSFTKYIALDTAYVKNWSPWLDLKILWRTVGVVIRGTGS
ncbi:MAG TPA: sugar transferase [Terriglobales bacterium]|nr:sugar transferase [Terriglobales bacterium]